MKKFSGLSFDDPDQRRRMRYLVVKDGDLDLNGAYAFKSKRELNDFLKDKYRPDVFAVFKIQDITPVKENVV